MADQDYLAKDQDIMPDGSLAPMGARDDATGTHAGVSPYALDAATRPAFSFDDLDDEIAPDRGPWLTRRRAIIGVSVVVVLAVVGALIARALQPANVPLRFTNAAVTEGNLTVTTSATGQISSGVYNLNFSTSGRITAIDVSPGQNVTAGQVLAQLDTTSLQDALNSAEAGYNSSQVNLNNAYTSQTYADKLAYDTYQQAIVRDAGSQDKLQQDLDQYNQSLAQAQSQVNSAQAQFQSAQAQLTAAQHNLADATLTAPVAGQIASVNGSVGAAAGGSSGSAFIVLVNLTSLSIVAQVNEADIGGVQAGQPVSFTVTAFPSDTFFGTVTSISPVGTTTQNVVTYPVTINIDANSAKQARLFPGMTAQITITTQQVIGALLVPNAALTYARAAVRSGRITATQAQQAIVQAQQLITSATDSTVKQGQASYVLEQQQGKVVAVPVVIGISNGTDTVALAGLSANDIILTGDNQTSTTTTTGASTGGSRLRNGGSLFGG